jgi:hypothetical protein
LALNGQSDRGRFEPGIAEVLKMTDKLEAELPTMLSEHKDIVAALNKLIEAARAENKPDIVHFAEKLMRASRLSDCALDRPLCEIETCCLTARISRQIRRCPLLLQ